MFESALERVAVVLFVLAACAHGWSLARRLRRIEEAQAQTLRALDGLRTYLYEIDPQFDDERALLARPQPASAGDDDEDPGPSLSGLALLELREEKAAAGRRTLSSNFLA